jgi:hypothetical protein
MNTTRGEDMTMNRRTFLAGAGAIAGVSIAGCAQLTGDEPITFEAMPANVPESVLEETGYEEDESNELEIERTFEAAGQEQDVVVTNWQSEYEKSIDLGPLGDRRAAIFTALTTPQVEVVGQTFNPVAEMSTEEIAAEIQDQYEEIGKLEPEDEAPVTILEQETTQTRFSGEVALEGGIKLDIYLHVSEPVTSGDDFVIAVGGYPQQLPGEKEHVLTMMERVEHDTEG